MLYICIPTNNAKRGNESLRSKLKRKEGSDREEKRREETGVVSIVQNCKKVNGAAVSWFAVPRFHGFAPWSLLACTHT